MKTRPNVLGRGGFCVFTPCNRADSVHLVLRRCSVWSVSLAQPVLAEWTESLANFSNSTFKLLIGDELLAALVPINLKILKRILCKANRWSFSEDFERASELHTAYSSNVCLPSDAVWWCAIAKCTSACKCANENNNSEQTAIRSSMWWKCIT